MASAIKEMVWDGFTSVESGMNDGIAGARLVPSQAQLLVNATTRGDYVTQRPGWSWILRVKTSDGFFQHVSPYRTVSGRTYLIVVVSGRFYRVDPISETVLDITPAGDPNPSNIMRGWSAQGQQFWVYQDGLSAPLIFDGASARRAGPGEIQVGSVIAYVQGRFWYTLPDGFHFRATDLVGNQTSGTAPYNYEDSILKETENTYLDEGGDFSVPWDSGGIVAMRATAVLDTSQGQGPLQVVCKNSVYSVNTPVDRDVWKDVSYPLVTESLMAGAVSHQATLNVNSDLMFRAKDGIRSFIIARRQFRDWGNTPQSFEVSKLIGNDSEALLPFASGAVYDNRLLMTTSPAYSAQGIYHRGLIALDLAPIASIQRQDAPRYDGLWTGLHIFQIVQSDIGAFIVARGTDGGIDLWRMTKGDLYDNETGEIEWTVVPRTFFVDRDAAGRPRWMLKKLETGDLYYDQLAGTPAFTVHWQPDSYPCWQEWETWEECAPVCPISLGCTPPSNFQTQYRPRYRLKQPPDTCADGAKRLPLRNFYQLNIRLDVVGAARLIGFRVGAHVEGEPVYKPTCNAPDEDCYDVECCGLDPFTYVSRESPEAASGGYYSYSSGYDYNDDGVPDAGYPEGGDDGDDIEGEGEVDGGEGGEGGDDWTFGGSSDDPVIPTDDQPELGCGGIPFFGTWADPETGVEREIGSSYETPTTINQWAASLWQQFHDYCVANSIVPTNAVIMSFYEESPADRWDSDQVFIYNVYHAAILRHWNLVIYYCP